MNFIKKLKNAVQKNSSLLCVGLDPDLTLMPDGISVFEFNKAIIEATSDLVCAYKLNFAFYEVLDIEGIKTLKRTVKCVPEDIPVIGDAKLGDIGNTAKFYAKTIFSTFNFDAATVSPYLGFDSIEPFIQYRDKGVFTLCRTSNRGAADFQDLRCQDGLGLQQQPEEADGIPQQVADWGNGIADVPQHSEAKGQSQGHLLESRGRHQATQVTGHLHDSGKPVTRNGGIAR